MKVRKAVFPVAGFGTRFLPATKAMPKELLPIVDKPLIQYVAEEAVNSGIETLIFVTGRNKRAIEDHFDINLELDFALRKKGKNKQADMVKNILPNGVECVFVRQVEQLGLGHAVSCAQRVVGEEPFAVLLADDFILNDYPSGMLGRLINGYEKTGSNYICLMEVEESQVDKYGIAKFDKKNRIVGLIEKPSIADAPSKMASIGRYILTNEIFPILENLSIGSGDEYQLSDAINVLASQGKVRGLELRGHRFDCGNVDGYVQAMIHVAERRTDGNTDIK